MLYPDYEGTPSYAEFLDLSARATHVGNLYPEIDTPNPVSTLHHGSLPGPWLRALVLANAAIVLEKTDALAQQPLPEECFKDFTGPEAALVAMVNSSINRQELSFGRNLSATPRPPRLAYCSGGGGHFMKIIGLLADMRINDPTFIQMDDNPITQVGLRVFTDQAGEAAAIQKAAKLGAPSVVTVVDLTVNGIVYKAGSMFNFVTELPNAQPGAREIVALDAVRNAAFLRAHATMIPPRPNGPTSRFPFGIQYDETQQHTASWPLEKIAAHINQAISNRDVWLPVSENH